MRVLAALLILAVSGCASAPIKKADALSLAAAEARLLEGCYVCLLEARDVFERLAVGRARPMVVGRLFEAYVLTGLREREMALDATGSFSKARELLPELPPAYDGAHYLEVAGLVPPDFAGTPRTELTPFRRAVPARARRTELKASLATGEGSGPFRAYLSASLDCVAAFVNQLDRDVQPAEILAETAPLVRYRLATCPLIRAPALEALLADVPEFVEAGLFLARQPTLIITAEYLRSRREWLTRALDTFPRSPSINYAMGAVYQTIGDCASAVRFYEDAIAIKERHEDAAMQRVICLGHIGQFVPAIDGATRIIDRGYYNLAEAYYWRAWNHHRRGDLPNARADIDTARKVLFNVAVLTLGGVIKYDQDDLALAEKDLVEAVGMDARQCIAQWYLGLVRFKQADWPETAAQFGRSADCYERSADENVKRRDQMRNSDQDPEFKAMQIAGFEAAIKEDRDQQWASVLNAANAFARADQPKTALEWLDRIPADAVLAPKAAELRKLIIGTLQ